jgi:hypothetical protein
VRGYNDLVLPPHESPTAAGPLLSRHPNWCHRLAATSASSPAPPREGRTRRGRTADPRDWRSRNTTGAVQHVVFQTQVDHPAVGRCAPSQGAQLALRACSASLPAQLGAEADGTVPSFRARTNLRFGRGLISAPAAAPGDGPGAGTGWPYEQAKAAPPPADGAGTSYSLAACSRAMSS